MKRIYIVSIIFLCFMESCIIGNSRSFKNTSYSWKKIPKDQKIIPSFHIAVLREGRDFFIPPFFLCYFDKKEGLYYFSTDFYTIRESVYSELIKIGYDLYNNSGKNFASGEFNINGKLIEYLPEKIGETVIYEDTLYRIATHTKPQIIIPDSIKNFTADLRLFLIHKEGIIDTIEIKNAEFELQRMKGIYSFF